MVASGNAGRRKKKGINNILREDSADYAGRIARAQCMFWTAAIAARGKIIE
jgi:hypothetical protein